MYKKKNIVKKTFISIICVIVMVFSMPVKAKADVIQDLVNVLLRIPDAIMWVSNRYLADRESDEMHINIGLKGVHGVKEDDGAIYNFFNIYEDTAENVKLNLMYEYAIGTDKNELARMVNER